jgi:hypothetical protein
LGADFANRCPRIAETVRGLNVVSLPIDGEAVALGDYGGATSARPRRLIRAQ